jgi:hypothetical protein
MYVYQPQLVWFFCVRDNHHIFFFGAYRCLISRPCHGLVWIEQTLESCVLCVGRTILVIVIGGVNVVFVLGSECSFILDGEQPALALAVVAPDVPCSNAQVARELGGGLCRGRRHCSEGEAGAARELSGAATVGALLSLACALAADLERDERAHDADRAAGHGRHELVYGWADDDALECIKHLCGRRVRDHHARRCTQPLAVPERAPRAARP